VTTRPIDFGILQRFGWLFREVNVGFREGIDAALKRGRVSLTFGQVSTLSVLSIQPGLNGAQLARRNMVTPQAMTGMLRQLAAKGLVERRDHPESERADSWHVTAKGEKQLARGRAAFAEATEKMLSALSPQEIATLQGYLQRCVRAMD
jgi:DNA-binding MarR family transcriptional regulator